MYFFELYMQLGGGSPFRKWGSCIYNRLKGILGGGMRRECREMADKNRDEEGCGKILRADGKGMHT
jgi:hypothetical protein